MNRIDWWFVLRFFLVLLVVFGGAFVLALALIDALLGGKS
jgi:hypothetical protein